jgi:hypothetical protein
MPETITKNELIKLIFQPPEKAAEFFRGKGIEVADDWKEGYKAARKNSFTVAGVAKIAILQKFFDAISKYLEGDLLRTNFTDHILGSFSEAGWVSPAHTSASRLNLIFDNNIQSTYMEGRYVGAMKNSVTRPLLQIIATIDKNTTPMCRGINRKVVNIHDPLLYKILPMKHHRCRTRFTTMSYAKAKKLGLKEYKASQLMQYKNEKGFDHKEKGFQPDLSNFGDSLVKKFKKDKKKHGY